MIECPSCGAPINEFVNKCPYCDNFINKPSFIEIEISQSLENQCISLLNEGEVLKMVELYKSETGGSNNQAKMYIDKLMNADSLSIPRPPRLRLVAALIMIIVTFVLCGISGFLTDNPLLGFVVAIVLALFVSRNIDNYTSKKFSQKYPVYYKFMKEYNSLSKSIQHPKK